MIKPLHARAPPTVGVNENVAAAEVLPATRSAAAIEKEETLKWEIEAARLDIEIWRTREATNRMQDKAHQ